MKIIERIAIFICMLIFSAYIAIEATVFLMESGFGLAAFPLIAGIAIANVKVANTLFK